ncbi:MAG: ECF-type riboflavin transporter substrate-binding protein [Clostridium sp.]
MFRRLTIEEIVAVGIGSAVFMILGRFASIPTGIPNTEFATCYAFLALIAVIYGAKPAFLIGFIGHTLKDMTYGTPWFSWVIASAVVGLIIGFSRRFVSIWDGEFNFRKIVTYNIFQIIANVVAWGFVAPTLDILFYAEPANKVYLQSGVAGLSNIVTCGVLGTILLYTYSKTRIKKGSLVKEIE